MVRPCGFPSKHLHEASTHCQNEGPQKCWASAVSFSRSPSSALLPFLRAGSPTKMDYRRKIGYPYSNLSKDLVLVTRSQELDPKDKPWSQAPTSPRCSAWRACPTPSSWAPPLSGEARAFGAREAAEWVFGLGNLALCCEGNGNSGLINPWLMNNLGRTLFVEGTPPIGVFLIRLFQLFVTLINSHLQFPETFVYHLFL